MQINLWEKEYKMFGFLQIKTKSELESIIRSLESNRSNNYKDNAQADFKKLAEEYKRLKEAGMLNEKQEKYYASVISEYAEFMKGYTHKDQTPYWT